MEVVYRRCSGVDIHKESISVCVLLMEEEGGKKQIRRFGTMTRDLLELSLWLRQLGVTHVAMESTGVYWKPVWNLLEGQFELLLVNAQHIKQVPGRKTDIRDCEWIADLLQHGLLRGSYVPKQEQRDLRDLTRYRVRLSEDKTRLANRIQKMLEDANIKLASVATDVLGASGRTMLQAIAAGEDDPEKLAQMARKGLRKKLPQLRLALQGRIRDHHRFLLRQLLEELRFTEEKINELDQRIQAQIRKRFKTLASFCLEKTDQTKSMMNLLLGQVRNFLEPRMHQAYSSMPVFQELMQDQAVEREAAEAFDEALPELLAGKSRPEDELQILVVPDNHAGQKLAQIAKDTLSETHLQIITSGNEIVFIREAQHVPPSDLPQLGSTARAAFLHVTHSDQAAPHTRSDIAWPTLP